MPRWPGYAIQSRPRLAATCRNAVSREQFFTASKPILRVASFARSTRLAGESRLIELAVSLSAKGGNLTAILAGVFLAISMFFVWRSFYGMRIVAKE
jgi:hypothetical protein